MDRMEKAELLREKAGISYEEAREALEASGWDMLQAMVNLENSGKLDKAKQNEEKKEHHMDKAQAAARKAEGFFSRLVNWMGAALEAGNKSQVIISKDGRQVLQVPVTVAVLLFLFLHGLFIFALIVSLVLGYRYTYRGRKENEAFQQDLREAEAAAEQINHHHQVNSFGEGV